jgi:hypothetical protein
MGKSKSLFAVLAFTAAVLIVALVATDREAESSDIERFGRFQIVVGCYHRSVGRGAVSKDDFIEATCGAFKIDTVTGEAWIYRERVDTQSVVSDDYDRKWEPIN